MRSEGVKSHRVGVKLAGVIDRSRWSVLALVVLFTLGLAWPMVRWVPEGTASQSPDTEVTRTQELVAERFADAVFRYFVLVEANEGEMLDKGPLVALFANTQQLREQPATGELLVELHDPSLGIDWPERSPSLSPKDAASPLLADIDRERLPRFAEGG